MLDPRLHALGRAGAASARRAPLDHHRATLLDVGYSAEHVGALADRDAPCWTALERAVLALADAVVCDDAVLSDADADTLNEHLDDDEILALAVAAGSQRQPASA